MSSSSSQAITQEWNLRNAFQVATIILFYDNNKKEKKKKEIYKLS